MHAYDDQYYDEGAMNGSGAVERKKERKKKKHHRKEEIPTEEVKSEEENVDPDYERKKRRSHRRRDEENEEEPGGEEVDDDEEERRKQRRKERKKRKKQQQLELEEEERHRSNVVVDEEGFGEHVNYPFEEAHDDDFDRYQPQNEESWNHEEPYSVQDESEEPHVESIKEKPPKTKKTGGFGKIFASFKRKGKKKDSVTAVQEEPRSSLSSSRNRDGEPGWQSNPEIFNPAFDDTHGSTTSKKKAKSTRPVANVTANVILLDGEEVEIQVDRKSTGRHVFESVCSSLDLLEKDFFGMTYVKKKLRTWFWLEMDKKISKQLESHDEWSFNFQVKFYPPEPVLLQEDVTRYLLCLQVRQDVYTGKLPCSWVTQALLGSLLVQSELGDYDPDEHGNDIDYLREFEFVLDQTEQLLEKICEMHRKHAGMQPDKADLKYLETAKRLELYGVDLHPARDNDDVQILIGVCYQGVLIYRERMRIGRFAWPKVLRISYKKNYFYLKIRSDRYDNSVAVVGFKMFDHNLAKRLWKNAVEQHTFFRMKEPQSTVNGNRGSLSTLFHPNKTIANAGSSGYTYSGKTLHQYRSMNLSRPTPARFDRSLNKRRTIGSMPAGLDRAGLQYRSMHSLNRSHPRDMTLNKTKSVEYLSGKPPQSGSTLGLGPVDHDDLFSNGSNRGSQRTKPLSQGFRPQHGSLGGVGYGNEPSFRSGDSINAADSYTVRHEDDFDDRASLPPLIIRQQPPQPTKRHHQDSDVFSADGIPLITTKPRTNRQMKPIVVETKRNIEYSDEEEEEISQPAPRRRTKQHKKIIVPPVQVLESQPTIAAVTVRGRGKIAVESPQSSLSRSSSPSNSIQQQKQQYTTITTTTTSNHSSPLLLPHQLPPPPPQIHMEDEELPSISMDHPRPPPVTLTKPKPPPVKPKPKMTVVKTTTTTVTENSNYRAPRPVPGQYQQQQQSHRRIDVRYTTNNDNDDLSSNDDML